MNQLLRIFPLFTLPHPINLHLSSILLDIATFSPVDVQTGIAKLNFIIFFLLSVFSIIVTFSTFPPVYVEPTFNIKVSPLLIFLTLLLFASSVLTPKSLLNI